MMKKTAYLLTTVLSTGLLLPLMQPAHAADSITAGAIKTANAPMSAQAVGDPRVAAASFVEHINFARVALAMKNGPLASQHILQARNMAAVVQGAEASQRRIARLESGRVVYSYETAYKYHYFPITTGPVQVKQMGNGPMWATNDLAVTDADMVYLTLDLSGDSANTYLTLAQNAIDKGDLTEASNQLAMLSDALVVVENEVALPAVKARDNIALARNFIAGKNYDGASYALGHASDALDDMATNEMYKSQRKAIVTMRKDVKALQGYIAKKDPNMMARASKNIDKWWADLKDWSKSEK